MTINKIKRFLKKEYEVSKFQGIKENKLYGKVNDQLVYWNLEKKGRNEYLLSHIWYYPVN